MHLFEPIKYFIKNRELVNYGIRIGFWEQGRRGNVNHREVGSTQLRERNESSECKGKESMTCAAVEMVSGVWGVICRDWFP